MRAARIQPQGRARLNQANPLSKNLRFAFIPGVGSVAGNYRTVAENSGITTGKFGRYTQALTNGPYPTFAGVDADTSGAFSVVVVGQLVAPGSWTAPLLALTKTDGTNGWKIGINANGAVGYTAYGSADYGGGASVAAAGCMGLNVVAHGIAAVFLDGALRETFPVGAINGVTDGNFCIGSRYPATDSTSNSRVALALYFDRVLTNAEHASIAANPWQLFEGQAPMLSAAGAPTGTVATATPSGVFASSAIGSATGTGQGRAAPAGVSATASIGTASAAGSTVVNGTASATGVSAVGAVGTPAASGAATKLASGVSAASSVGTVTAAGTVVVNGTATPAGVSATASVGSVSASGATVIHGNASAAGVAASSAIGATVARGSAYAAANGVQAAAAVGSASANGGVSVAGNAQPAGVTAATSVGTPSASGATVTHGNASAAGVFASASVGAVAISASASVQSAGVSVLASIGQPIAFGQIQVNGVAYPGGVIAYARVGSATAGSRTYASAPVGPGYSRPFANTTRPRQVNTRRP